MFLYYILLNYVVIQDHALHAPHYFQWLRFILWPTVWSVFVMVQDVHSATFGSSVVEMSINPVG